MNVISNIERDFLAKGLIKDYTDTKSMRSKTIFRQIVATDYVGGKIYFDHDSQLDNSTIKAIEVIPRNVVAVWSINGAEIEGILQADLSAGTIVIGENNNLKLVIPLPCIDRSSNNGQFCYIDSPSFSHVWGDCYVEDVAQSLLGQVLAIRVYFN